jgi:PAS domain S-box-containing protein
METLNSEAIISPNFTKSDIETLKQYFEFNKKYYEKINEELTAELTKHPLWGPILKNQTPEQQKQQNERSLELQRAAIYEGKWEEYSHDLITQGVAYARMNVSYTDWYGIIKMYKDYLIPHIKKDFANAAVDAITYLDGLSKFIDYAMYGIAEAYFIEKNNIIKANEERFRAIFENSTDHIFLIDKEGIITMINHPFQGIKKEDIIGRSIFDIQSEKNVAAVKEAIKPAFENKTPGIYDTLHIKNGRKIYYSNSISPIVDEDGKVNAAIVISRDVTERRVAATKIQELNASLEEKVKKRTQELKESEETQRLLTGEVSDYAIIMLTPEGIINSWNEGVQKIKGYTEKEIIGKYFSIFYTPDAIEKKIPELDLETAKKEGRFEYEGWRTRKDGSLFWANVVITTLKRDGKLIGFSKITRDLTERKLFEDKLKKSNEQLETTYKELESFSYSVSHDLRAPLRAINGFTQILADNYSDTANEEVKDAMYEITSNAKKMGQLIDDLLEFSRIGKQGLIKTKLDMNDLVNYIINEFKTQEQYKKAEFKVNFLENAEGDRGMLKQVMMNIIANALKYSAKKEKPIIEIGSYKKGDNHVFYVKDNGAGFDMAYYNKLFGVFQRLHSAGEFEGTGVGLAIVHRIITKHGGEVWAEGKVNEGATFYISLPYSN